MAAATVTTINAVDILGPAGCCRKWLYSCFLVPTAALYQCGVCQWEHSVIAFLICGHKIENDFTISETNQQAFTVYQLVLFLCPLIMTHWAPRPQNITFVCTNKGQVSVAVHGKQKTEMKTFPLWPSKWKMYFEQIRVNFLFTFISNCQSFFIFNN